MENTKVCLGVFTPHGIVLDSDLGLSNGSLYCVATHNLLISPMESASGAQTLESSLFLWDVAAK